MRDFKGMKRQRGRNRKPGGGGGASQANATNPNRSWDSQGPENIKVRGNAQTVYERYMQLARDASAAGDRVLAENYTQHAEHYFRVLRALQPSRPVSEIAQRELAGQGFDIDFEDESGAQAAAIMAAEKVEADRVAQAEARQRDRDAEGGERQPDRYHNNDRAPSGDRAERTDRPAGEQPRREWRDRDDRGPREPREPREPRPEAAPSEPRAESDSQADAQTGEGGRRESRRERWERRRDERNRRFDGEGGEGEPQAGGDTPAPAAETDDRPADRVERPERAERKPRRDAPRAEASSDDDAPTALPGFLTRSSAPTPAASAVAEGEAAAPRKRATRKKAAVVADES